MIQTFYEGKMFNLVPVHLLNPFEALLDLGGPAAFLTGFTKGRMNPLFNQIRALKETLKNYKNQLFKIIFMFF